MTPEEYVEKVQKGELKDQALNAHLKAGYRVRGVHMGYLRDRQSLDYATFLEMENPGFRPTPRRIAAAPIKSPVRKIRVCAAQYQMRRISSWREFERQVEFFVSTAEQYDCHFLLFPELFTLQLFSTLKSGLSGTEAVRALSEMAERYRKLFIRMAGRSGIFIVGGTHPVRRGGAIRNTAHLFTPGGNVYTQEKLHITPNERENYGFAPGEGLRVFETGLARISVLVCYDIQFPELARLLTLAGVEVLFVPFSADERKSYMRIRYTAQARAVENDLYAVLAGNVGNLPQFENFLIHYGESIICTPSDFPFPIDAIAARADSENETVVISDLDLGALVQTREIGSVRHLRDRRKDLYWIETVTPVEVIRTE